MTITNQNAKIYRGDTAVLEVTLTMADGAPFDPALAPVIKYRVSPNWHSSEEEALVVKDLGSGITTTDEGVSIDLTAEDTDLEPGFYYHELKVIDDQGVEDVATAMVGTFVVKKALNMTPTPG